MNGDEPLVPLLRSVLQGFAISPGDTVVVAVSGGIDSVVLLDLVVSAGYRSVVAAHIDHGIRSRSEREEDRRVVRDHADRLDVPFAERMIPEGLVESRAARSGESVEAIARSERYRLLREIAASIQADHPTILTAHHRDDQAETVLMRIVSGRSPFESLGIAPARSIPEEWSREKTGSSRESREAQTPSIRIVRPLLEVSRERLLRYAAERGLSWHTDSTNA
ncbi:MAG: tRNA lysidine(34) synthetase TilS, partial [Alkalispirochaeta sp.]